MWKTTIVRILETKTSETSFSIDVIVVTHFWIPTKIKKKKKEKTPK
jgi:hypothetical protein